MRDYSKKKIKNKNQTYPLSSYRKRKLTFGATHTPQHRRMNKTASTHVFFNCDGCGWKSFKGRYCPKCGLEAKDWGKYKHW